jgi:cobalamin biosynthesis Co2+ chelatase CbiK
MRLYKLPMEVYQEVMLQMHHEAPNEEADKVQIQVEQLQGNRDSSGKSLSKVEGEGFGNLNRNVQTPVFYG